MPELPEVETVRRGLAPLLTGRRVEAVVVLHARAVRRHVAGSEDFAGRLRGQRFDQPLRRGKYLWVPMQDASEALVAHLGMSGQFRVGRPGDEGHATHPHLRASITLVDAATGGRSHLHFLDQRTFGGLAVEPLDADGVPVSVRHIALDPFDPSYDVARTARALRRRQTEVKRALLDQTLVSGIGNIYADEALWRCRLHYARPTQGLSQRRAVEVLESARDVMAEALAEGGTSFDTLYVDVNGESGYFDRSLQAYGREGEPCPRCGTPLVREAFTNRSSYRCPRCQRPPRRPRPPSVVRTGDRGGSRL